MPKKTENISDSTTLEVLPKSHLTRHFKKAHSNADANASKVQNKFWKTVAKAQKKIPAIEQVVAAYYCAFDPNTPQKTRAILLASLAYFVLPLDTIPDFLFGFGFTDDLAVITFALQALKNDMKQIHFDAAKKKLEENDPSKA